MVVYLVCKGTRKSVADRERDIITKKNIFHGKGFVKPMGTVGRRDWDDEVLRCIGSAWFLMIYIGMP